MLEFEGDLIKVLLNDSFYPPRLEGLWGHCWSHDTGRRWILRYWLHSHVRLHLLHAGEVELRGAASSLGLCCPVHSVMPFLMLGIGIDDMFVIMQSWETLKPNEKSRGL